MQKNQGQPDLESLIDGRDKILSNAEALLEDAVCLLNKGSYPRAFALAHLASEELAKLVMIGGALLRTVHGQSFDWVTFRKEFCKHGVKLKARGWMDFFMKPVAEGELSVLESNVLDKEITTRNNMKNDSLYVSLKDDRFTAPSGVIDKEIATAECEQTKNRLQYCRGFISESDLWVAAYKRQQGQVEKTERNNSA